MALLGLMSLSFMTIKAAIVLVDEIDVQLKLGKMPYQVVMTSGVSRLIPVIRYDHARHDSIIYRCVFCLYGSHYCVCFRAGYRVGAYDCSRVLPHLF